MANWKKVIVSGSQASLAGLSGSLLTDGKLLFAQGDEGAITSAADVTLNEDGHIEATFSGSASGSFEGDGSGLTGVVATIENSLSDGNGIADFTYDGGTAGIEIALDLDGTTLSVGSDGLKVAAGGITATELNASVAGDGLAGGDGTALSVNVDDATLEIDADSLRIKDSGVTFAKIQDLSSMSVIGRTLAGDGVSNEVSILDEDDFTSNSATALATQQSIKAYVDAQSHEDVNLGYTAAAAQGTVTNDQGDDAVIPGATSTAAGLLTVAISSSIALNNAKETNVDTDLSIGSRTANTLDVVSSDGDDATIPAATSTQAGLLTVAISSSIALNNAKETNVTTNLGYTAAASQGTVTSSDGDNATIPLADATNAGLMTAAEKSAIAANTAKTVIGTDDEIEITENPTGTFQVGLPDSVTITDALTVNGNVILGDSTSDNVTINGDLTVLGTTTTLNTENLLVEDAFILLASGSASDADGGIIIDGGDSNGEGFIYDASAGNSSDAGRWGFQSAMGDTAAVSAPDAFASAVVVGADNVLPVASNRYTAKGNMFIAANEDIYIYS